MHAPDYQFALCSFLADPANPENRRRYRAAVAALPIDTELAAMTEKEQLDRFCRIYTDTPEAQRPELLRRVSLIVDCLTETEGDIDR